ncbi:uncharacterized protein [Linepithema humile]|uniref:uncharacterized protein n=1 Tax=Linepithema humile TaxID=83485 RepID=UPI00351EBDD8
MSDPYTFPNEILEIIFNFCDVYTLYQLTMVCRQFNIVACDTLNNKSQHLFVSITNQKGKKLYEREVGLLRKPHKKNMLASLALTAEARYKPLLSSYNSIFITYYNWISASYKESNIYEEQEKIEMVLLNTGELNQRKMEEVILNIQ